MLLLGGIMNNSHFKIHGIMVGKERIENLPVYKAVKRHANGQKRMLLDQNIIPFFDNLKTIDDYIDRYEQMQGKIFHGL